MSLGEDICYIYDLEDGKFDFGKNASRNFPLYLHILGKEFVTTETYYNETIGLILEDEIVFN